MRQILARALAFRRKRSLPAAILLWFLLALLAPPSAVAQYPPPPPPSPSPSPSPSPPTTVSPASSPSPSPAPSCTAAERAAFEKAQAKETKAFNQAQKAAMEAFQASSPHSKQEKKAFKRLQRKHRGAFRRGQRADERQFEANCLLARNTSTTTLPKTIRIWHLLLLAAGLLGAFVIRRRWTFIASHRWLGS